MNGWLSAPARRPLTALSLALLLAALAFLGVRRLTADNSLKTLFPRNDPAATALNRVFTQFPVAEELLVFATVPGPEPDPDRLLTFAARLDAQLKADPETAPLVSSVRYRIGEQTRDFITRVVVPNGLFYLTDEQFAAARQRLTKPAMAEQFRQNEAMLAAPGPAAGALAKALLQDPLRLREFIEQRLVAARPFKTYQNRDAFLTEDGRSLLIRIAGTKPPSDLDFSRRLTLAVTAVAKRAGGDDHLQLEFSGAYPIASHSERSIRRDSISSVRGSILCLALLFVFTFRRPLRLFAVTFAPVALGVLYGFGVFSTVSRTVTPLTAVIGAVLAGIGIDYAIFYLVHYQERRSAGDAPPLAAAETIGRIGGALFAAWVTSVVGFIAIVFASVPALRQFSVVGSLGLAGALLGTDFILPALLVLLDRTDPARPRSPFRMPMTPLVKWIDRHARSCVAVACVLTLIAIGWLAWRGPGLALESDMTVMHPRPNPPLDAQANIARRMGASPDSLIVHLRADSPERLLSLAHRVNDRLTSPAARQAGVTSTVSLASLLPNPDVAERRLRETGQAVADQVTADFDAAVGESSFDPKAYEPYRGFLNVLLTAKRAPDVQDLLAYNQLAENLLPRVANPGDVPTEAISLIFLGGDGVTADPRIAIGALRALLADVPGATLTGMSVLSLDTEATLRRDLPRLIIAAVAIVAVYLLLHFRSPALAVLAVLPTICSLLCLLTVARVAGAKLNLANIVSVPLLIGIDVDYGIFLVSALRRGGSRAELRDTAVPSARAVVLCAMSTLTGFGSLAFTSVPAIRSLGWAVGIGVIVCAAASLFLLLPVLLIMKDRSMATAPKGLGLVLLVGCVLCTGCVAPSGRLYFPAAPLEKTADVEWYDVKGSGHRDFGVGYDVNHRVDRLIYCDTAGKPNREYRLSDYANDRVPHLILLLDSLPFETVRDRYDAGDLRWFDPPQKMIAPFPSLTEVCYTEILRAPPLPGMIDEHFDPRVQQRRHAIWERVKGYKQPWERRLDYGLGLLEQGESFLNPRDWYAAELERGRLAVEQSPRRVSFIYLTSAAGMICKYGKPGAEEVITGAQRLCLQLLYERRGAIKVSMMADHGHNYTVSRHSDIIQRLRAAGFHPTKRLETDQDCVVELNGLVTTCGIHTRRPADVATALCREEAIEVAIYQSGAQSIIRTAHGTAAIQSRGGQLRYVPIDADVLNYLPVIERMKAAGVMDADGFASDEAWFAQTLDHPWPDAPRRVWDALHGRFVTAPDVIVSIKDGFYSGVLQYERFIHMASTHGGLNQVNSATFVMTMTGRLHSPVRHRDVIGTLEPGLDPEVRR